MIDKAFIICYEYKLYNRKDFNLLVTEPYTGGKDCWSSAKKKNPVYLKMCWRTTAAMIKSHLGMDAGNPFALLSPPSFN